MSDDTTIIIITKNNHKYIKRSINLMKEYTRKYHNITNVIFYDNNSYDTTTNELNKIQHPKIITILKEESKDKKKIITECLENTSTNNVIILDQELYTKTHQIQRQIKKLRKTDLLLPSRFHSKTRCTYTQKMSEVRDKGRNFSIQLMTVLEYTDPINKNKAYKTKKILPLLKKLKSKRNFWIELIILCKKKKYRITETKTHYIQEEKPEPDKLTQFIRDMKELRLLSKNVKNLNKNKK